MPRSANSEFLELALERFKLAAEAESEIRTNGLADLKFYEGQQWDEAIASARRRGGRPCLKMNHLPQFKRQITNEQRQQRPAIQVNPIGDGADVDTAEIFQGMVRHIEVNSEAEIAHDTAFECMVVSSFGYFRVITERIDDTEDQEIKIKRIRDPFTVYFDPLTLEPDYSDARFCFIIEDVPKKLFKSQFRDAEAASLTEYSSIGDTAPNWLTDSHVRVAEYFYVETDANGRNKRVKWAKITAVDVLRERDWLGKYIPVIPVLGEEMVIDGKRVLKGMVRDAKDPQRQYNYMQSAAAERIALLPKAPYIVVTGQIEGLEEKWSKANIENYPYLEYNAVDVKGTPAPPPARNDVEAPIQAMREMIALADNDLKASIGIYDASLGKQGPEQSGKAIQQRKQQGDIATLNYADNLARSIRHEGRILIDLIPKVYDIPRVQRIVLPDSSVKQVVVHNGPGQEKDAQGLAEEQKINKIYDIGTGKYDVAVSVGPSYQSKRQEAVATQLELVKAYPEALKIFGDLIVRNMDIPQAKEMADRIKKTLPPTLQDDQDTDPAQQLIIMQAKMQQMKQQNELLTKALSEATEVVKTKQIEQQGKSEIAHMQELSKQEIVKMQEVTKIAVAQIKATKDIQQSIADRELEEYKLLHGSAHDSAKDAQSQAHDKFMATQQAERDKEAQASDQEHEAGMNAVNQAHEADMQAQAGEQAQELQAAKPAANGTGK